MKCAIYARVSTEDQNCETQLAELREYAKRRGWQVHREYVDHGWSGKKINRPQLTELMRASEMHHFGAVIVVKLDRFGRSAVDLMKNLQTLRSRDIQFLAISQGIDTDDRNPAAGLLLQILAAVAEFELELIRERVNAGLAHARDHGTKSGKGIGRPKLVFRRDKAIALRVKGLSFRKIARQLRVAEATVRRACAKTPAAQKSGHLTTAKTSAASPSRV